MTFIPVPDCAMARIEFAQGTQMFSIAPWFRKSDFLYTDHTALAELVDDIVGTALVPGTSASVNYTGVRVYDMRSDQAPVVYVNTSAGPGQGGAEFTPISDCIVLTLRTAERGRSGRGRLYFSGLSETSITLGLWNQATADMVTNFYADLRDGAFGIGWTAVVASKYHNGEPRQTAASYPVTQFEVRNLVVATQRRRIDRP